MVLPLLDRDADAFAALVPDAIIGFDREGVVRAWNPGAERVYGWPAARAIGMAIEELLATRHPFGLGYLRDQLAAEGSWDGELFRTAGDGRELHLSVRRMLRADADMVLEWSREAEQVSESEIAAHRFSNLFHAMAAAFWELDFSEVRKTIGGLVAAGEPDLVGRLRGDPALVDRLIPMVRVIDVNETTLQLFGIPSREAALARDTAWAWPAESRHVFAESLVAAAERRDSFSVETVLSGWDGRRIDALFTVCWPSGHKARGTVLVGVIDITGRKHAFQKLEASEERYRTLFQHMPIALAQINLQPLYDRLSDLHATGTSELADHVERTPEFLDEVLRLPTIEEANLEALRLFGAESVEDLRGPIEWAWKARPETIRRSLAARLRGRPNYTEETVVNRLDGEPVDVIYTMAFPLTLVESGINVVGFIDLSERKQASLALRQSEYRYRDLFEHIPVALWQCDTSRLGGLFEGWRAQGVVSLSRHFDAHAEALERCLRLVTIQEVNSEAVRLCRGTSAADFAGRTGWDFWHQSTAAFRHAIEARYAGAMGHSEETQIRTLDGGTADVAFTVAFAPALQEQGITVVATLDISDRRAAEVRLREIQAEFSHASRITTLGELTASIAHEVNQPLAAIAASGQASLRWLDRPQPDLGEVAALATDIVADARRASEIIARIRGMAMKREPDPGAVDINAMIEEALLIVRHEAMARQVTIETRFAGGLPPAVADRVQLQQVIVNLALNAIQAIVAADPAERRITVVTARGGAGEIEVAVRDTGPGIAAEHLGHLFTGFFTTKEGGMGMGLPICRSILQSLGGSIAAENGPEGACFRFTLPVPPGL
ncbi:PAS domain S-box protein [Sphingomonas sp.]|uniref:PAS domain-containing sensor histidine kinase n=1 Tax=Sphingomonas sp. TaxID=28214 RepID=UPI001B2077E7|nr:PAS domain S-box protein [Sphingomonas sp.]MBO9714273.1 PAS domain S-box protein [Sphingomonas sp.]